MFIFFNFRHQIFLYEYYLVRKVNEKKKKEIENQKQIY